MNMISSGNKNNVLQIDFGVKGYREMISYIKEKKHQGQNIQGAAIDYVTSLVMSELKRQGYRSTGIGRLYFEDALDYQIKFEISRIGQCRMQKKVPRTLNFEISKTRDIPKVE